MGLAAGAAIGGYIGALIGLVIGAILDKMHQDGIQLWKRQAKEPKKIEDTDPNDFVVGSILLAAVVVQSDGQVDDLELSYVRSFLADQFGNDQMHNYWAILQETLKEELDIKKTTLQIKQTTSYETRLQLIHFLFGIANADYTIDDQEIATIKIISLHLGVANEEYESIKSMFYSEMDAYYKILELKPSVSDSTVKYAYKEMLKKYHPDKLIHLGEGVRNAANVKFLKVQEAYENIKNERGFQ